MPRVVDIALGDPAIGGALIAGHFGGYVKIATEELGRRECAAALELTRVVARRGKPVIVHTIYGAEPLPALEPLRAAGRADLSLARGLRPRDGRAVAARAGAARAPARAAPLAAGCRARGRRSWPARAPARCCPSPSAGSSWRATASPVPPLADGGRRGGDGGRGRSPRRPPPRSSWWPAASVHKSDVGGVLLGVRGAAAARDGWARLMDAAARAGATDARVLVTPMLDPGVEAVVGVLRDRQFGPVVMFGLGGVLVEALDDVVFRVAPFGADEAETMIAEIHGHRLFGPVRGRPAVDRAALGDLLARVSELASDRPDLAELDLNPVICSARGAAIADARAVVG